MGSGHLQSRHLQSEHLQSGHLQSQKRETNAICEWDIKLGTG